MAIDQAATSYEEPQAEIIQADLSAIGINTNIVVEETSQVLCILWYLLLRAPERKQDPAGYLRWLYPVYP